LLADDNENHMLTAPDLRGAQGTRL